MPTVPVDGRPQLSLADVAVRHGVFGAPLSSFQQIAPDRFVTGPPPSPPLPAPSGSGGFSSLTAASTAPAGRPSAAAALWPNLPAQKS